MPPLEDEMLVEEDVALPPIVVRPRGVDGEKEPSLRRVFPRAPKAMPKAGTLARFAHLVGSSDTEINDPRRMDLDADS